MRTQVKRTLITIRNKHLPDLSTFKLYTHDDPKPLPILNAVIAYIDCSQLLKDINNASILIYIIMSGKMLKT